jgi:hypothetical protein
MSEFGDRSLVLLNFSKRLVTAMKFSVWLLPIVLKERGGAPRRLSLFVFRLATAIKLVLVDLLLKV